MRIPRAVCVLFGVAAAFAESPESGRIERDGARAMLIVEGPRPVDSAAITIAEQLGVPVNVEDPPYLFRGDQDDVTAEVSRAANPAHRILVPKGARLAVPFKLNPDGSPEDIRVLLQDLIVHANAVLPYAYRLVEDGQFLTIAPTRTRDANGRSIEIFPLMERRVTIELGTRPAWESANLMAAQLSAQTGFHVACCQGGVAGIPWGQSAIPFEAHDEPARSVLNRLIAMTPGGGPSGYLPNGGAYWLQRCDMSRTPWCFINLAHIPARAVTPPPPAPPKPSDPSRWFDRQTPPRRGTL